MDLRFIAFHFPKLSSKTAENGLLPDVAPNGSVFMQSTHLSDFDLLIFKSIQKAKVRYFQNAQNSLVAKHLI